MRTLAAGRIPELNAWRMHNGTIWRWNRACYGVLDGKPGLRIEARFLPSGPTVIDEIANAAFFIGLVLGLADEYGEVADQMSFDDAKSNFFAAARFGLKSQILWLYGKSISAQRLILEELLPHARRGLEKSGLEKSEIDRYLGIIQTRVESGKTGSQWMLDSLASMDKVAKQNVKLRSLTAAMRANQETGAPLHEWPVAEIPASSVWIDNYKTVEQFMVTDLFTVRPEDTIELPANLMHWKHVRHVPVEDSHGRLAGIISHRDLLELFAVERANGSSETTVRDVMKREPITVSPETPTLEALLTMREKNIGCLPVVKDDRLVGMITAHDFLTVSARLLEERLRSFV